MSLKQYGPAPSTVEDLTTKAYVDGLSSGLTSAIVAGYTEATDIDFNADFLIVLDVSDTTGGVSGTLKKIKDGVISNLIGGQEYMVQQGRLFW